MTAPAISSPQNLCGPTTVAAIIIPTGVNNVVWYNASNVELLPTTPLTTGIYYYYAAIKMGDCESARTMVQINVVPTTTPQPPTMLSPQDFCAGAIVADIAVPNNQILFYMGGVALLPETPLSSGTYYAAQQAGACESTSYLPVVVSIGGTTDVPVAPSPQTFGIGATVANLAATGAGVVWYDVSTGGTPLELNTPLVSGNYYAGSGVCPGFRRTVNVKLPLQGVVAINGTAVYGETLTANTAGITSAAPLGNITYQWKRGTTNIGTNSSNYQITAADIGETITVTVWAANYTDSLVSLPTATVAKRTITFTGTVTATKVYDGTNSFTNAQITVNNANSFSSLIGADVFTLDKTGVTGTFGPNVGTGTLTLSGNFTLSGADAGNYILLAQPTVAATVAKANTATALSSSLNPSVYGQSVMFTATVTAVSPGGGTPAGTVEFREGSTVLGTGTLDENGVATFTTSALRAGEHFIVALYMGNDNYTPSNSVVLLQGVLCPANFKDHEGNDITVTHLAGRCWTSNMKNKTYTDGETIPFARAYQDKPENLEIFGLLYDWYSAVRVETWHAASLPPQGVCPQGWHIPTRDEFLELAAYSATQLKSVNFWIGTTGTDDFGFTALPAGMYNYALFRFVDIYGITGYWTCGRGTDSQAFGLMMNYYCKYIQVQTLLVQEGLSVRCVKD